MRIAALILGILGGLAAGALGMTWISDYNKTKALIESVGALGADLSEIQGMVTAAYIMLAGMLGGIAGGILTWKGKGKIAGPIMVVLAILPAFFAGKALVFTFLLLVGGVLAVVSKPKVAEAV